MGQQAGEAVAVELVRDIPGGEGWWVEAHRVILLDDRLGRVRQRSVLEHERVHAAAGDVAAHGPDAGRLQRRREQRADQAAAAALVDDSQLDDAMRWVDTLDLSGDAWVRALAAELDVDVPRMRARLERL